MLLFADRGADAVSVREIATAAGVSPALILRHYGSKDGLRAAVDDHVAAIFENMLAPVLQPSDVSPLDPAVLPSLAEAVAGSLPADSALPAYLGRMLLTGGPAGSALFRKLHGVSRNALAEMIESGAADAGADPDVRAAFLLINDLAVLILRTQLHGILGIDPLSNAGLQRWGAEVFPIYQNGLGGGDNRTPPPALSTRRPMKGDR